MSGSILPQPYANCKLTSPDSSLQVSRDKQTDGPRRVTSWVMSDCESWSGVISIGPRETSRADVANSMEDSTRSKAQGIETFPDQSRPNPHTSPTSLACLSWRTLDWTGQKRAAACAGSEDRLLEGHACSTCCGLRAGSDLRSSPPLELRSRRCERNRNHGTTSASRPTFLFGRPHVVHWLRWQPPSFPSNVAERAD